MPHKFSKRNKIIGGLLILCLIGAGVYIIFYKPNTCLPDKTLRIVSANEKTRLDLKAQIQEETSKNYILDKDLSLINVYRKACFEGGQKPWQFETFSAIQYKGVIIGELSFLTSDNTKLDNLKSSPVYILLDQSKSGELVKLVRYTKNVDFNDQENIYLLKFTSKSGLNDNALSGYEWQKIDNLQWVSTDKAKTWQFQS
ncbi:MAG: hypothetical protein WCK98_06005 [bacterium]